MSIVLRGANLRKSYAKEGGDFLEILKGINFELREGEAVCIIGASGAGKSTLLHILGTLDRPTSGDVFFRGNKLSSMGDEELAQFRNKKMGFVFQFHYLLSEWSAVENVMMPARLGGVAKKQARERAEELLAHLGLSHRLHHFPNQLSGGEQQRVAIARALVQGPEVLFADEPTGNLDTQNGELIRQLFFQLREEMKISLVVVTHDLQFRSGFDRVLQMKDGLWDL